VACPPAFLFAFPRQTSDDAFRSKPFDQTTTTMKPEYILLIVVGVGALTFTGFLVADYFSVDSIKERGRRKRRRERKKLRKRAKSEMEQEESSEEHTPHLET
jgi:hypothetical protein